ncbi:MAG: helix-turn-helix domain-containing protein, partial [Steroidobacteraceae bacterium]
MVDILWIYLDICQPSTSGRIPMIGQRLKLARAAAGLSLRDLVQRLDNPVTAQALNKYEHDEMMPGSAVLLSLSRALE